MPERASGDRNQGNVMKPTVLFVDDEPKILATLKRMFQRDCEVVIADNGADAIELLSDGSIDVIVCDQRMPGMSGIDVLRKARELSPRTERIVLTGYADLDAAIRAVNEGEVYRYVNKPWSNEELIITVLAAGKKALAEAEQQSHQAAQNFDIHQCGVLILDKDRDLVNTIFYGLGDQASVYTADTPDNAMQILKGRDIGVLVADTDIGGREVTEAIFKFKSEYPDLVVMIVTYRADIVHVVELINSGQIYRFIPKPTSLNILLPNLKSAIETYFRTPAGIRRLEELAKEDDEDWL
ncbi:MAG: response regulator [Wenzhouxiangellaceae bacterium]